MHRLLSLATVLLLAGGAVCVAASPASAVGGTPPRNVPVVLKNLQTLKCATVFSDYGTTNNNVPLVQFDCDAHALRRWVLTPVGDDQHWWIKNVHTGKCMSILGGASTADNTYLAQYTCDDHPSRLWHFEYFFSQFWRLKSHLSGKCATVAGGVRTDNNWALVQHDCDNHGSRWWEVAPA